MCSITESVALALSVKPTLVKEKKLPTTRLPLPPESVSLVWVSRAARTVRIDLDPRNRQRRRDFDSDGGRRVAGAGVCLLGHSLRPPLASSGLLPFVLLRGGVGERMTRTAATRRPSIATTSSSPPGKGTRSPIFGTRPRRAKV